jgi:hypothetical protein
MEILSIKNGGGSYGLKHFALNPQVPLKQYKRNPPLTINDITV